MEIAVPGSPVPVSAQTLAVVLAGGWLGARAGAAAMGLYLLAGVLGAPVFAGGASGSAVLTGPTAGYLAGFVFAAALMGALEERLGLQRWGLRRWAMSLAGALLAHLLILGAGALRLSALVGFQRAWEAGVAPFLIGGLLKSAIAAAAVVVLRGRWLPAAEPAE